MNCENLNNAQEILTAFQECRDAGEEIDLFEALAWQDEPPIEAFVEIVQKTRLESRSGGNSVIHWSVAHSILFGVIIIFPLMSQVYPALSQTVSDISTLSLSDNGWQCEVRRKQNDRYFGRYKVIQHFCKKGEREIDDRDEAANQCAAFDTRQQMKRSYDKRRTSNKVSCQEKMISFGKQLNDSKRIWKSDGWYRMRLEGKWVEFSEVKFRDICSDARVADSDNLYIAGCSSMTSQDFHEKLKIEGKTSKDDAYIDSGIGDGKDINEENKKAYNDTPGFLEGSIDLLLKYPLLAVLVPVVIISLLGFGLWRIRKAK